MESGDIVLAALSQADGQRKMRPVLLLCQLPPFGDWLACGISLQIRHRVDRFDEVVHRDDPDFAESGLRTMSLIRLGFVGALAESDIAGTLGRIAPERLQRLRRNFAQHLLGESITV
jgi:mRNA interferase MazF